MKIKYLVKWNYASSMGVYLVDQVVELEVGKAAEINRDSPGVLVEEEITTEAQSAQSKNLVGEEEETEKKTTQRDRMVREPKKRRGG